MDILVTGSCGYSGSHTINELLARGHAVHIVDNFCNAPPHVRDHLARIAWNRPTCIRADVRERETMRSALSDFRAEAVIHFAAFKAAGESCARPLDYFDNNISGTIALLDAMHDADVYQLVFSSSATVYGSPNRCPIREDAPLHTTNPHGRTELVMEQLIVDVAMAEHRFKAAILRCSNPAGAYSCGEPGEDPCGIPNSLMPCICQVAAGNRPCLNVFGKEYDTPDDTGVRDHIHVEDLARAHADALDALSSRGKGFTVKLGTGRVYSVLEVVRALEATSGRKVPLKIVPRRAGDVATCYVDPTLAKTTLGWSAKFDLWCMCADAWKWKSRPPNDDEEARMAIRRHSHHGRKVITPARHHAGSSQVLRVTGASRLSTWHS